MKGAELQCRGERLAVGPTTGIAAEVLYLVVVFDCHLRMRRRDEENGMYNGGGGPAAE